MKKIYKLILVGLICEIIPMLCVSCEGVFNGIYDDAPTDDTFEPGIHSGAAANHYTLMLDARDYDRWHYIDLHSREISEIKIPTTLSGEWDGRSGFTYNQVEGTEYTPYKTMKTDTQEAPEHWDLAIHHFDVKTNGGMAAETGYTTLNRLPALSEIAGNLEWCADEWNTNQVITDLTEMMGYRIGYQNSMVNPVLTGWVKMDISTPPPTYSASGRVYLLKMADGTVAALRLRSYMSDRGTKGFLTVDLIYPYE